MSLSGSFSTISWSSTGSQLWIVGTDGTRNRFLVEGSSSRWSPDGTRIVCLADGEPNGKQIFVRWMDAEGAAIQVTRVSQAPRGLHWSPDSNRIAFTMIVPEEESWELPSMPDSPEGAEWTAPPRILRDMHFRQDRVGFLDEGYRHLFVVTAVGGTPFGLQARVQARAVRGEHAAGVRSRRPRSGTIVPPLSIRITEPNSERGVFPTVRVRPGSHFSRKAPRILEDTSLARGLLVPRHTGLRSWKAH